MSAEDFWDKKAVEIGLKGGMSIEIGHVPGRKSIALSVRESGSPVRKVVGYLKDANAASALHSALWGMVHTLTYDANPLDPDGR